VNAEVQSNIHLFLDIATPASLILVFIIGLLIHKAVAGVQIEQFRVKEELVSKQDEMRRDMDQKHAENKTVLSTHIAKDDALFEGIGKTLTRIEAVVSGRGRR
jgi:hypothetical protein